MTGFFAILCLLCGSLALIDFRRGIIPDALNLAIACVGLIRAVVADGPFAGIEAVAEALAVGTIFWLFRRLYFVLRRIQGLGLGDVKFLAAATACVGIAAIPMALECTHAAHIAGHQRTDRHDDDGDQRQRNQDLDDGEAGVAPFS